MNARYWLVWRHRTYSRKNDGWIVHATTDMPGPTLCGRKWDEGQFGEVGPDGEPGCVQCRRALQKLGVIEPTPPESKP